MMDELVKEGPLPLYFQLKQILKKQIERGELKQGGIIPSERDLIDRYQISRPTVRQAITELVNDGWLTRERGRGTFVAKPKHSEWFLESLSSFSEELQRKGLSSATKVLSLNQVATNPELEAVFGKAYKQFYCLERLRYVEEAPVVLVTTYIPYELAANLEAEDLERNSLYQVLQARYRLAIAYANRTLKAVNVGVEDAEHLQVEPHAAIQLVMTDAYLEDGRVFELSHSRFRGDVSSFTAVLKFSK